MKPPNAATEADKRVGILSPAAPTRCAPSNAFLNRYADRTRHVGSGVDRRRSWSEGMASALRLGSVDLIPYAPGAATPTVGIAASKCAGQRPFVGLGGLEPPASSLSAITRLPLCNPAFCRTCATVGGEVMRSCNPARITARTSVVATGKVCQQPVAGKAMGLPVGAAPSRVTVTAVRLPARPRAGRLARRAANTARPATTARAAASTPSETTSQPGCPLGPGARGQRRTPRPHARLHRQAGPAPRRPRAARRPWRADGRHRGSRRSTSQRVDELAA
jgi:hypothetical protein